MRNTWRELVRVLNDVEEEEERGRALVNAYIEERSRWLLINKQLQYQIFRDGRPDVRRAHQAMLVSRFAEFLEQFLRPEEVQVINRFLAAPSGGALPDEAVSSLEEQLADLYADNENAIIVDGRSVTVTGARKILVRHQP